MPAAECEKAGDRHGDCRIAVEALGRIADREARTSRDRAAVGPLEAEQDAHERRLAGAVRTDQRDDLAWREIEVDAFEDRAARTREVDVARGEQDVRAAGKRPGVCVMMVIVVGAMIVMVMPMPMVVMVMGAVRVRVCVHAGAAAQLAHKPVTSTMTRVGPKPAPRAAASISSKATGVATSATVAQRSHARMIWRVPCLPCGA